MCPRNFGSGQFEVSDTTATEEFADNPLVTGEPGVRFYAGVPIQTPSGYPLGALCVLDTIPRSLTERQRRALKVLAREAMAQLELRRRVKEADRAQLRSEQTSRFLRLIADSLPVRVAYIDREFRYRFVNDAYERELGISRDWIEGHTVLEVMGEEVYRASKPLLDRALKGESFAEESYIPYAHGGQWIRSTYAPDFSESGNVRGLVCHVQNITRHRETEATLVSERAWLDRTLDRAQVATFDWDVQRDRVFGNPLLNKFFGLPDSAYGLPAATYLALLSEEDRKEHAASIAASSSTGSPYEVQYRLVGTDGRERYVLARGDTELDEDGNTVRLSGVILDITDRVNSEKDLHEAKAWLEALLQSAEVGTWNFNPLTGRLHGDANLARMFGLPPGDSTPDIYIAQIHPDDRAAVTVAFNNTVETGIAYNIEFRLAREGGDRWVVSRGYAEFDEQRRVVRLPGLVVDITDQKAAEAAVRASEAALRESEERFRQLVELSPATVWFGLPDGDLVYISQDFYENTGMTPEEAVPRGWVVAIHEDDRAGVIQHWDTARREETLYDTEFRIRYRDGEYRWVSARALPLRDKDGVVTGWLGSNSDIHERKTAEERLQAAVEERTEELRNAVREAEGFNYSISHDLRTPLRAIVATSTILLEEATDRLDEEHRLLLHRQSVNANRMAVLIDELLRLSRFARVEVKRQRLDLSAKARAVAVELDAKHEVTVQDGMYAYADQDLLQTILVNLLDNACKFSPHGGTVAVGQSGSTFWVRDQGIGFDMAFVKKIFLPFERLVLDREFPGTGIGLALVKRIVERHGGLVWAESELGKGATFYFTLSPDGTFEGI